MSDFIKIEKLTDGFRDSEATAHFKDYDCRTHFIRVERDFLTAHEGGWLLPAATIHVDPKTNAHLVELPHEAETGARRLWVDQENMQRSRP